MDFSSLAFIWGEGDEGVGEIEADAGSLLLHVADDGQPRRRRREGEAEGAEGIHRDQVVLGRQPQSLAAGEVEGHRRDLHRVPPGQVVAGVEQCHAHRRRQPRRSPAEGVPQ